jgi:hypothetical protein
LFAHVFATGERPPLLAYRVVQDSAGRALAVYAKTSCLTLQNGYSLFLLAATTTPLLPPSLTGGLPNDSLLSARAIDPFGRVLWASPVQYVSSTTGAWGGGPRIGGLRLEVTIRPEAASRLVIGGVPPSRLPTAAVLLMLTLVFSGLAIQQLRQQQHFANGSSRTYRTSCAHRCSRYWCLRNCSGWTSCERSRSGSTHSKWSIEKLAG